MIKRITLLIFIGLTFGSHFLPAQTITNVQVRQEGLDVIITYDMAGQLQPGDEIKHKTRHRQGDFLSGK
jgi:hypothetical protein